MSDWADDEAGRIAKELCKHATKPVGPVIATHLRKAKADGVREAAKLADEECEEARKRALEEGGREEYVRANQLYSFADGCAAIAYALHSRAARIDSN